jgi:hypothetical protein
VWKAARGGAGGTPVAIKRLNNPGLKQAVSRTESSPDGRVLLTGPGPSRGG